MGFGRTEAGRPVSGGRVQGRIDLMANNVFLDTLNIRRAAGGRSKWSFTAFRFPGLLSLGAPPLRSLSTIGLYSITLALEQKAGRLERLEIPHLVWLYIAFFYLSGLAMVYFQRGLNTALGLLCSMAFAVLGSLFGFLFAIPRSGSSADSMSTDANVASLTRNASVPTGGSQPSTLNRAVNTNLEQISDWLTKVLVGIGLSQIVQAPNALRNLAAYLATGLGGPTETATVVASLIVIYFSVVGFIGGYLVTRLVLQSAFLRADRSRPHSEEHTKEDTAS